MMLSQENLCINKSGRVFTCAYHKDMDGNEITKETIENLLTDNKGVYEMYAIYHDKDKVKANHWHIILWAKTPRKLFTIANLLNVAPNMVQIVKNKPLMLRYLCHLDNNDKESYSLEEVMTNSKPYEEIVRGGMISNKQVYLDILERGNEAILEYIDIVEPNRLRTIMSLCGNEYQRGIVNELNELRNDMKSLLTNTSKVIDNLEWQKNEYLTMTKLIEDKVPEISEGFKNGILAISNSITSLRRFKK